MNNRKWLPVAVIVGAIVVIALVVGTKYNSLVSEREQVNGSWAQVQNVLQRRNDLIPNLVATVKGYAAHEKETFTQIAEARAKLAGARTPSDAANANAQLDSALSRLLVIAEAYPQLKANENFVRLQDELAGTENRIAVERQRYNNEVRDYNRTIKRFPTNLVARTFDFQRRDYFEADVDAQKAPEVRF
ncbi:MAG TPA: LemA family protein [Kofleriaceae bacterium]|nr:LemA family protein [Kofleriaceae bacterium]